MTIPLFKVLMSAAARERAGDILDSGYVGQGEVCEAFEREFGFVVSAPEPPLLVNSCTSAIDLALHLCGVASERGVPPPEVITTPITCTATNSPPALRGARLVWADVDPLTGNIDPASVARLVTARTRAIVAVDWAGRACDYDALRAAAPGVPIIEDAAHGFIAERGGCSITQSGGDYICWSFQAIKHLTMVDGGALLAPCAQMERARLLRWYGLDRRSSADFRCAQDITEIGYKYQSNDVSAAIGLANIGPAIRAVSAARRNAEYYDRVLNGLPGVTLPPPDPGCSYWLYSLTVDDRPGFMAYMAALGIATSQVHRRNDAHGAFVLAGTTREALPGVEAFDARHVAIPVGYWLTPSQREYVACAVVAWACRGRIAGQQLEAICAAV